MYTNISANKTKTLLLMAGFVAFLVLLGWVIQQATGSTGLVAGFAIFGLVYAIVGYFVSDKVALAISGARPVTKSEAPELYRVIENLAITAGLPTPKVYIINDPAPNAFATGRDPQHASVAVTAGLLDLMNESELQGVIAHELSHVGNYDIRLMAIVLILVTIVTVLSNFFVRFTFWGGGRRDDRNNSGDNGVLMLIGLVLALVAPIVGTIMQLAVSRRREYLADASGALLTRYPEGLAKALAKIGQYKRPMEHANTATAHLYFANPLGSSAAKFLTNLFSTHPPIADRIKRLETMEAKP